jgi:hypothetical protein
MVCRPQQQRTLIATLKHLGLRGGHEPMVKEWIAKEDFGRNVLVRR